MQAMPEKPTTKRAQRKTGDALPANHLLAALPRDAYQLLARSLSPVTLVFGKVLYEPADLIRDVYFPCGSVVSLLTIVDQHNALEVGLVGLEGMVGVPLALGVELSPVRALVQGEGPALQMSARAFRKAFEASPPLRRALHRYTYQLMAQITQTAACNRFHVVEARLARWLLMTRDRMGSSELHLTHEFLSDMLGVRRVGVTEAAHALQQGGLIDYRRGYVRILDNASLEAASCTCYAATSFAAMKLVPSL
jgi:CRP-like cAMP-binding protein